MALSLTNVRYYTQLDPYFYTIDNRPLEDLATRDTQLSAELDKRTLCIDVTGAASITTITQMPVGWSIAVNGTGDYTITHTLGTASFIATAVVSDASGGFAYSSVPTSTTFKVGTRSTAGGAAHKRFTVLVTCF